MQSIVETGTGSVTARLPVKTPERMIETFAASLMPDSVDPEKRSVECVANSGAVMDRYDWWTGEKYRLQLSMEPSAVRLARFNGGAPLLDNHMAYSSREQLGVVEKGWIQDSKLKATVRFSKREEADAIFQDVLDGIVRSVSAGVVIHRLKDITPEDEKTKTYLAVDWEPIEVSTACVPADPGAGFLSAQLGRINLSGVPIEAPGATDKRADPAPKEKTMEETMTGGGAGAAPNDKQTAAVDVAAIRTEASAAATAAERQRQKEIRDAFTVARKYCDLPETFAESYINDGTDVTKFRLELQTAMAKANAKQPETIGHHTAGITSDERETLRKRMTASLLVRDDPKKHKDLIELGRPFANLTLLELAREYLAAAGVNVRGLPKIEVARIALQGHLGAAEYFAGGLHTTSDFPNILLDAANKTLRQAYEAAPRTFTLFMRQATAADFKNVNRVQLSDAPVLQPVNEHGEFKRGTMSDSKEFYKLATFGEIIGVTRQTVINDDLQALTRIPAALGMAAATLESDTAWNVITVNAAMADGVPLFHANHKNLNGTNALTDAGLSTARKAGRMQTGPKGTILNIVFRYLIVPAALERTAEQLINPLQLSPSVYTDVIPQWMRSLVPVVEPRLDDDPVGDTTWYMAADPSTIDTIEYCYLEGQEGVYIETRQGFEIDGMEIKARLDFAAKAIDYRGLSKNTVA